MTGKTDAECVKKSTPISRILAFKIRPDLWRNGMANSLTEPVLS